MSFLFDKRTKKAVGVIWAVVAIIVSLSMVFAFAPGILEYFLGQ